MIKTMRLLYTKFKLNGQVGLLNTRLTYLCIAVSAYAFISTIGFVYAMFFSPVQKVYFGVNSNMQLIRMIPLSQPYYSDKTVGQFAINSLVSAFNYSYINLNRHFRSLVNEGFNEDGLSSLLENLKTNGILKQIKQKKLFVRFAATTAPFIINKAMYYNRATKKRIFRWTVQFRGITTYTDGSTAASTANDFNVEVSRVSSLEDGQAMRITSVVAKLIEDPKVGVIKSND